MVKESEEQMEEAGEEQGKEVGEEEKHDVVSEFKQSQYLVFTNTLPTAFLQKVSFHSPRQKMDWEAGAYNHSPDL